MPGTYRWSPTVLDPVESKYLWAVAANWTLVAGSASATGYPGIGDKVQGAPNANRIWVKGTVFVGTSPNTATLDYAIDMETSAAAGAAGDSYIGVLPGSRLYVCGHARTQNTSGRTANAIAIQNHGEIIFCTDFAAAPAATKYGWQVGNTSINHRRLVNDGGHIYSSNQSGSSNGYFFGQNGLLVEAINNCRFSWIGDSTNPLVQSSGFSNSSVRKVFNGVWADNCGGIVQSTQLNSGTYGFTRVTITNTRPGVTYAIDFGHGTAACVYSEVRVGGKVRHTGNCSNVLVKDNCAFLGGYVFQPTAASSALEECTDLTVYDASFVSSGLMLNNCCSLITRPLLVISRSENNGKIFGFNGLSSSQVKVKDGIWEPLRTSSTPGECVATNNAPTGSVNVFEGCIFNPMKSGAGVRWGEVTNSSATENGICQFVHCSGAGFSGLIAYAHNAPNTEISGIEKLRMNSCLAINFSTTVDPFGSGPYGYLQTDTILDVETSHNAFGYVVGARPWLRAPATFTAGSNTYNLRTGYLGVALTYAHLVTAGTEDPDLGRWDVFLTPWAVGPKPKIYDWALTLPSIVATTDVGREDEVLAAWLVQDLSGANFPLHANYREGCTPAAYRQFCRTAWRSSDQALNGKAKDAGAPTTEAGGWIGAVPGYDSPDPTMKVAMRGRRYAPGTADTLSYVGIPLPPSKLWPEDVADGYGRPTLGGVEIQCALKVNTDPGNLNYDGSLKSLMGNWLMPNLTQGVNVVGEFQLDVQRTLPPLNGGVLATPYGAGGVLESPSHLGPGGESYNWYYNTPGVYFPSDTAILCASGVYGPASPESEDPSTGPEATFFTRQRNALRNYYIGTQAGTSWDGVYNANLSYYDPFWGWMGMHARSGLDDLLQHAIARYSRVRFEYYDKGSNNFINMSEYAIAYRGWNLAYWLLNDTEAWRGAHDNASKAAHAGIGQYEALGSATNSTGWQRRAAYALEAIIDAFHQGRTQLIYDAPWTDTLRLRSLLKYLCDPNGPPLKASPSWGEITMQRTGAVIPKITRQNLPLTGGGTRMIHVTFQGGVEALALIRWYDEMPVAAGGRDSRVLLAIKTLADYWWDNTRVPPPASGPAALRGTFLDFASANYNNGGIGASEDLNSFFFGVYWWLAMMFRSQDYLDKGDELFDAATRSPFDGVVGPWLMNSTYANIKQQHEWIRRMPEAFAYRRDAVAAIAEGPGTQLPEIVLTPSTTATFNATAGGANPANQSRTVTNNGTGILDGLSTVITYGPEGTGWLAADLDSPVADTNLVLKATTGSLAPGTFTATVEVRSTAEGVINTPQSFAVQFVVAAAPAPAIAIVPPGPITVDTTVGTPGSIEVTRAVQNGASSGTLDNLARQIIYLDGAGWLNVTFDSTTAPTTMHLFFTVGSLPAGSYRATLRITSTAVGITNSPQDILVTFNVNDLGGLLGLARRIKRGIAAIIGG